MDESTIIFGRLYCDKMFDTYTDIVSAVIGDINKNRHSDRNWNQMGGNWANGRDRT